MPLGGPPPTPTATGVVESLGKRSEFGNFTSQLLDT